MSEKEERMILVVGDKHDIEELVHLFPWGKLDKTKRTVFDRTEAIKQMAEAMAIPYFDDIHASEVDMLQALAEAALDALIKEI